MLAEAEPELPVEDREADVWEPLIAVADLAGGEWPELARSACKALAGAEDPESGTTGERVLSDIRDLFDGGEMFTATLLDRLPRRWSPRGASGSSGKTLSSPVAGETAASVRDQVAAEVIGEQAKGYAREDFADAWDRSCTADDTITPGIPTSPASRWVNRCSPWDG